MSLDSSLGEVIPARLTAAFAITLQITACSQ
jgi:hypothetical protein